MKRALEILSVLLLAALLQGCSHTAEPDEAFLASNDLCLIEKGHSIHVYDPIGCQLGFSRTKKEFRVHDDKMSDYYVLTLNKIPVSAGDKVKGTLRWSGPSGVTTRQDVVFTVEKMDGEGRVWLWNSGKQIAVSVRILY